MIAEIVQAEYDTADVFFLLAVILAAAAAILYAIAVRHVDANDPVARRRPEVTAWAPVAGWVAVAFFSVGLLCL